MAAPRTVLVADDDDRVRYLLALTLTRGALWAVEAADGDEALALARRARPALAVLNLQMPGPGGLEVCRRLRADPATAAMPVVIVTGAYAPAVLARAAEARADAVVAKPFSPAALLALVRRLLPP
jgi:CheY-like chemotaxis protein